MFRLKRLNEPLGTPEAPQYESSYSEGLISVIDGHCEVRLPETRDRLIMLGYRDIDEPELESSPLNTHVEPTASRPRSKSRKHPRR